MSLPVLDLNKYKLRIPSERTRFGGFTLGIPFLTSSKETNIGDTPIFHLGRKGNY